MYKRQVCCYRAGGRLYIAGNGGSAADAQHLAAEFVSKLARERAPLPAEADLTRLTGDGPDPLAGLQARERADAVRRAVLALPERYREPIVLFYFQEMDLRETARILGIPEGTLKARLHRGRELLKRKAAAR